MHTPFKRRILLFIGMVTFLCPVASISADENSPRPSTKTRDELFLQIFKRSAPDIPINSYIFIDINGGAQQKVKAVLSADEYSILLHAKSVFAALSQQSLLPDVLRRLEAQIDADGWISRAALEQQGLLTSFNLSEFSLTVSMSPKMRQRQITYLTAPMIAPSSVAAIHPSPVSAYVNLDLKSVVSNTETAGKATNDSVTGFSTTGAINVMGVVLESSALGRIDSENSLERGDIRLIYDQPQHALRYTFGDLRYSSMGYQNALTVGGVSVAKDFSLQPHKPSYRTDHYEFYLEREATVQVWVKESLVSTLQLPAGSHDIRGFTPSIGQNNIQLHIEDSAGRKEVLEFSYLFNPILLQKGRNKFSYNAGFRRVRKNDTYQYDVNKPVVAASYLLGYTDNHTLGGYAQVDDVMTLLGGQTIHANRFGLIQLDMAASRNADSQYGLAAKMAWSGTFGGKLGKNIQSYLGLEYLGKNFGALNDASATEKDAINFNAALAFPLGNAVNAQIRGSYTPTRVSNKVDAHLVDVTITRRWGKYLSTRAALRRLGSDKNITKTQLLFGISFNRSSGASNVYIRKEMESNTLVSGWDSGRPSNSSGPYGFATTRLKSGNVEHRAGAGYWGNQARAEVSHTRTAVDQTTGRLVRDKTAIHLQSTLVFADNTFALSRPVVGSFAIVKGIKGLKGVQLKVNPDGQGGSSALSNVISPAVLVNIPSYRLKDLSILPVKPPFGATPDKMTYSLAATYKSGFLLEVGKARSIAGLGTLVDDQGQPLENLPIEIKRVDDSNEKIVTSTTSRRGRFQMLDIQPGWYEIRPLSSSPLGIVVVEIQQTQNNVYRLGKVTMPKLP
jgi:outer membrane usher protein